MNELHDAARGGSTERTLTVLSRGVIDIDQGDPTGMTPLMLAASFGHSRVARILLNKRASMSIVNDDGFAALHLSAQQGNLAVTKLLVKAGADLEAKVFIDGSTPLILAAQQGHPEVIMGILIEAGANPNSRMLDGATSLYIAAQHGHVDTTKVLLRAKANPLLTYSSLSGVTFIPLDIAAQKGHLGVARELIQEHGIEGCGGASGGIQALQVAAETQHVEIMGILTSAGVVDTGAALIAAAACGRESSVKFLLQQRKRSSSGQGAAYLDFFHPSGETPLVGSIEACRSCSPRITRLLVDAGADTTRAVRLKNARGLVFFDDTPLALTNIIIRGKNIKGKVATEEQLHSLEATRRLLLRVEAVHAVSWLWTSENAPSVTHTASKGKGKTKVTPTPLTSMLPILRRRAGRPRVLLAALFRNSTKP